MSRLTVFAACCFLAAPSFLNAGEVEGIINLPPRPQPSRGVSLYGKYSSGQDRPPSSSGFAVVYLKPRNGTAPLVERPIPTMDQNGMRFVPRILPIQAGSQVRFLNSDKMFHNVFSLSPTKKFDLGRHPRGDFQHLTFDQPGVVQVFCDIHPQMAGFVVVVESSHYAVLEPEGTYRMSGVPSGEYEVRIWSEGMTQFETVGGVTVAPSGSTRFTASLKD